MIITSKIGNNAFEGLYWVKVVSTAIDGARESQVCLLTGFFFFAPRHRGLFSFFSFFHFFFLISFLILIKHA